MRLTGPNVGEDRYRDDEACEQDELTRRRHPERQDVAARDEPVAVQPADPGQDREERALDHERNPIAGRPELADRRELRDRAKDAGAGEQRDRDQRHGGEPAQDLAARRAAEQERELDEPAGPNGGSGQVHHVDRDVVAGDARVERMAGDGLERQEHERKHPHGTRRPSVGNSDRRGRRAQRGHDRRDRIGDPEAGRERPVVRQEPGGPEKDGDERRHEQRRPAAARREAEQCTACGDEETCEEEPARDNVAGARPCRRGQRGRRRGTPGSDRERDHSGLGVAVVGDDPPEHRVVPVSEAGQRDDERLSTGHVRLAAEHGVAAVPDSADAGGGADRIVEDDAHLLRRAGEDRAVGGVRAEQHRMRGCRGREGERDADGCPGCSDGLSHARRTLASRGNRPPSRAPHVPRR